MFSGVVKTLAFYPIFTLLLVFQIKNSKIADMMKNPVKYYPALTPCLTVECDTWRDGECIHIRKVSK